jgi:hypothetical protein
VTEKLSDPYAVLALALTPVIIVMLTWLVTPQGFESAAFKLSHEMTQLLDPGHTRTSAVWARFEELCVRGYLAVGGCICPEAG